MKNIGFAVVFALMSVPAAHAMDVSDFKVGDIACYDRLGPFNVIGRVVELNASKGEVFLENEKGKRTWYPASKFRNVTSCKLTDEGVRWAVDQGVTLMSQ